MLGPLPSHIGWLSGDIVKIVILCIRSRGACSRICVPDRAIKLEFRCINDVRRVKQAYVYNARIRPPVDSLSINNAKRLACGHFILQPGVILVSDFITSPALSQQVITDKEK